MKTVWPTIKQESSKNVHYLSPLSHSVVWCQTSQLVTFRELHPATQRLLLSQHFLLSRSLYLGPSQKFPKGIKVFVTKELLTRINKMTCYPKHGPAPPCLQHTGSCWWWVGLGVGAAQVPMPQGCMCLLYTGTNSQGLQFPLRHSLLGSFLKTQPKVQTKLYAIRLPLITSNRK